jgi:2-polyprenyl-3-methyl-5-hydroxy-6-metoxy-1,4-benzoquinol methylase
VVGEQRYDESAIEVGMKSLISLQCLKHGLPLNLNESENQYECLSGCAFPVRKEIPRFVSEKNYARSFGSQWNAFRKTQLDSFTGTSIFKDRLTRLVGGFGGVFKEKGVLEAGCGAGAFTEIMLAAGAHVFAVDISTAVEANYQNCKNYPNYFVCQADILKLPVVPEQFDIVVCVGVIQHTPNPEETIRALCSYLKPGGLMVIDHYTYGYAISPSRRALRSFLVKMPPDFTLRFCKVLVGLLWPVHQLLWRYKNCPGFGKLHRMFVYISPVVDYHDAYFQLIPAHLRSWAVLDTHDTLTDVYKHFRSAEEISNILRECGMTEIEAVYAGNGVEARARKPLKVEKNLMEITKRCN